MERDEAQSPQSPAKVRFKLNIAQQIENVKETSEQGKIQRKIIYSQNNRLIAVVGKRALIVYELPEDLSSLNDEVASLEPVKEFTLVSGTYDGILNVQLNEENVDESWLVLSSKIMKTVHLLRLDGIPEEDSNQETDVLGGMLYQPISGHEVKISNVGANAGHGFWENIDVVFTTDSKQVTINTHHETYMISIDNSADNKNYLKQHSIPYLKNEVVTPFKRGDDDFLFCEALENVSTWQFSALRVEEADSFSNTKLGLKGRKPRIVEALELTREVDGQEEHFFRVVAILDDEEVVCKEVIGTSKGETYVSSVNSQTLCVFRWPFFAYVVGHDEVIISPLAKNGVHIHQRLNIAKTDRIHRIGFSHSGCLYILVLSEDETG